MHLIYTGNILYFSKFPFCHVYNELHKFVLNVSWMVHKELLESLTGDVLERNDSA